MGKRLIMGGSPAGDNVTSFNLELGIVGGAGTTTRHDDGGFPSGNPGDTVSIIGRTYILDTAQNRADLVGVDLNDTLEGTAGNDLIVWENQRSGLGSSYYLLPSGGTAAVDYFALGDGDDLINLTYITDNNISTPNIPYTDNANIDGGAGNDIVWSGQGDDVITGGGGTSETLFGGGGDDEIVGSTGAFNNISGDSGNDQLFGGDSVDAIQGGSENDSAFGGSGNDFIDGGSGDDVLSGGGNADDMMGGSGNDRVAGDAGNDTIDGGDGFLDTLYGGSGNDRLLDDDGAKFVYGGSENDTAVISYSASWNQGVATLFGGAATDTITVTGAQDGLGLVLYGDELNGVGDGSDTIFARGNYGNVTATLGGGDDLFRYVLTGTPTGARIDTVYGGSGADTIESGAGADHLYGDAGNDTLEGGLGGDFLFGGSEIDVITYANSAGGVTMGLTGVAGVGNDAQGDVASNDIENLTGSAHADSLYGNASVNVILGLGGDDTIEGLGGADVLDGGTGVNWLSYANSNAGVVVSLTTNTGTFGHAEGDNITNFQNLIGSTLADTLTGNVDANIIDGGTGSDSLLGLGGNDTVFGGTGGDTIEGGAGSDTLFGGASQEGNWISYANSSGNGGIGVTVNIGNNGVSGVGTDAQGDVIQFFDNIIGSAHNDSLTGNLNANIIYGGDGVDTIRGGNGADSMVGGDDGDWLDYTLAGAVTVDMSAGTASGGHAAGDTFAEFANLMGSGDDDVLIGNAASNIILGKTGVDTIDGGLGNDSLYGGGNGDWLSFASSGTGVTANLATSLATGAGTDTLSGFQHVLGTNAADTLTGDGLANSLVGNGGADLLQGGLEIDSLFGGAGDDTLVAGANSTTGGPSTVAGWDGEVGSAPINIAVAAGATLASDYAFGGSETDTLNIQQASGRVVYTTLNAAIPSFLSGVEIILAGAAADVINLTYNDGGTRAAYGSAITIIAGDGADVVFSGAGNDVVIGGLRNGVGTGIPGTPGDTLYGGQGNDAIFGDDFDPSSTGGNDDFLFGGSGDDTISAGVGNDTAFGGSGLDQLNGGAGDDYLDDTDSSDLYGGQGSDMLVIRSGSSGSSYNLIGGKNDGSDGADRAFAGGVYNAVTANLGSGGDFYVSSTVDNGLADGQIDRVFGEDDNDALSSWYGNDTLYGGDGNDGLWGGSGVDTILGGTGTDYLYGGAGNGDLMMGGDGDDYYYFARTDGIDRIDDDDPTGVDQNNYIVVTPVFDLAGNMVAGSGVFEIDHDLYDDAGGPSDHSDMVQLVDIGDPGGMHRLTILEGSGATSSIEFDANEIGVIALWNNDAAGGTPVITIYQWDEATGLYIMA